MGRIKPASMHSINAEDDVPLLGGAQGKRLHDEAHSEGGSAFTAFFTMCTACAGAGILSLPLAVSEIGVVAGVVVLVIFGAINTFTLRLLVDLTDRHRAQLERSQFSYEQLVKCALGPRWGRCFSVIILCTQFGALVAYWVILLDLSVPVMRHNHALAGALSQDEMRAAVAYGLALCVMFPLSFYEKIHNLWIVVVLAILSVVWTAGVIVSEGVQAHVDGTAAGELDHSSFVVTDWISTLPAIVFTFNCHQQLTPVYGWTKPEQRQLVRNTVLPGALMFCSAIYMVTAVTGFLKFGNRTQGDILLNFCNLENDGCDYVNATWYETAAWKADSSKLLMAFHVVMAFPVVLFPALRALDSELPQRCTSKQSLVVVGVRNLIAVLATATLAVFLPNVQAVFGFVGGVLCSCSVFIFPCAMKLYAPSVHAHKLGVGGAAQHSLQRMLAAVLLLFGFFLIGSSLYTSISGVIGSTAGKNDTGLGGGAGAPAWGPGG